MRQSTIKIHPKKVKVPLSIVGEEVVESSLRQGGVAAFSLSKTKKCDYLEPKEEFIKKDPLGYSTPH